MSLRNLDPSEHAVYIPTGDSLAFGEIVAYLRHLYPNVEITFHRNSELPLNDWNRTVILIGGGKSNITFRWLQAALNPPMHGYEHKYPPLYDPKGFIFREDERIRLEPSFEGRLLSKDVGVVIRAPNPFYQDKKVFVFVGAYAHGTYGAALWATQSKNLAWLWRYRIRQRLVELISRRPETNSVEIALQVPAVGQLSRAEIPSIGEPRFGTTTVGGNPTIFTLQTGMQTLTTAWLPRTSLRIRLKVRKAPARSKMCPTVSKPDKRRPTKAWSRRRQLADFIK